MAFAKDLVVEYTNELVVASMEFGLLDIDSACPITDKISYLEGLRQSIVVG